MTRPERIFAWVYEEGSRRRHVWRGKVGPGGDGQTEYVRADLAPAPSAVRVKPLEWIQVESAFPRIVFEAKTLFGRYVAWPSGDWKLHGSGIGHHTVGETLEAAKAAAQADHDARIRAALDLTPDPRVTALVDAAENLAIAIGMGWDLEGCTENVRAALAAMKGGDHG